LDDSCRDVVWMDGWMEFELSVSHLDVYVKVGEVDKYGKTEGKEVSSMLSRRRGEGNTIYS
jgi:hypothetical protein